MIQQINLYRKEFSRSTDAPDFKHAVAACSAVAALMVVIFLVQQFQLYQINSEISGVEASSEAIKNEIGAVEGSNSNANLTSIDEQNKQLETTLANLRELTVTLSSQSGSVANREGFSGHFDGLVRQHMTGIALSRIRFFDGGSDIELEGFASPAEIAPKYLSALHSDKAFTDADFGQLKMQRSKDTGQIAFLLLHESEENQ